MKKFNLQELTSNSSGKTSGTVTVGIIISLIGTLSFLMGCIDKMFISKDIDVLTQSIIVIGIGASLMGYHKSQDIKKDLTQSIETLTPEKDDTK